MNQIARAKPGDVVSIVLKEKLFYRNLNDGLALVSAVWAPSYAPSARTVLLKQKDHLLGEMTFDHDFHHFEILERGKL